VFAIGLFPLLGSLPVVGSRAMLINGAYNSLTSAVHVDVFDSAVLFPFAAILLQCLHLSCESSSPITCADTVCIQDIAQGQDAFQLVHVRPVHHGQDFDLVCTHAFERQIQPLIRVDVRKSLRIPQFTDLLIRAFRQLSLQPRKVDNTNDTSSIHHQPRSEFTRSNLLQRLPNRDLGRQQLARNLHDSYYLTLTRSLARLRRRQVYAILHGQRFVDGLMLQP
jgi:hypothetical protein